jgi:hypothetical protein
VEQAYRSLLGGLFNKVLRTPEELEAQSIDMEFDCKVCKLLQFAEL